MVRTFIVILALLSVLLTGVALAAPAGLSPAAGTVPDDLKTAIEDGIHMLEGGAYRTFLRRFMHPTEWQDLLQTVPEDTLVAEFAQNRAATLLKALQYARTARPSVSSDGKQVTWSLDAMPGSPAQLPLVFVKPGARWYIRS